jgi:autotransporter-associated beta strand protein
MLFGHDHGPRSRRRTLSSPLNLLRLLCEELEERAAPALGAGIMHPTFMLYRPPGDIHPHAMSGPTGFTPAQIRQAYGMNLVTFGVVTGDGTGQTIAIVDAYDQPNIATDLAAFDTQFGLPAPPTFTKVNQSGAANPLPNPAPHSGFKWGVETSLDVEWAHVMAPKASILLLEANSGSSADLFPAVDTARNTAGVSVVSMSFGFDETSMSNTFDSHFTTPTGHSGVTFVASSGDNGSYSQSGSTTQIVSYPAVSANVLAVGGTTLGINADSSYSSESAWGHGTNSNTQGGSGGGISQFFGQPSYQSGVVTQSSTNRTVPDVSIDGDPSTGVSYYDSYDNGASTPWDVVGGTSLSAPMWAGIIAVANQGRLINGFTTLDGPSTTLPKIYALPATDFHDVITGNNGYAAGPGYDLVTGLGSPYANLVIRDLSVNVPTIATFTASAEAVTAGTSVTLKASSVGEINGTVSVVNFYRESNGTPGLQIGQDTFLGAGTQNGTTWTFATSTIGLAAGTYTYYAVAVDSTMVSSSVGSATLAVGPRVWADTRWAGMANGTTVDADPLNPGMVTATIGTDAFASVNAAIAAAPANTTVVVNGANGGMGGNFGEAVTVNASIVLAIQYGPVTFNSLTDTVTTSTILVAGFPLTIGSDNSSTQITGVIVGPGSLIKVGTGTLTLGGANLYTGATSVSGGTLSIGTVAAGGSASNIGASTGAVGNLVLQGGSTLLYTGALASSDRGFTIGSGGAMVSVATGGATLTLGGNIANGANSLTVAGAGNLTIGGILTGAPGTATLTKGAAAADTATLTFSAADALNTAGLTVADGTLALATTTLSVNRLLTIAAGASANSTGTLFLVSTNTPFSGSVLAEPEVSGAGMLNLTSTTNGPNSPDIYFNPNDITNMLADYGTSITVNLNLGSSQRYVYAKTNGADFLDYGGEAIFTGNISGSGGLTLIGQNTYVNSSNQEMDVPFVLTGADTFGGQLEVQRGSLYLNSANALPSGVALLMDPTTGNNARLFLWGHNVTVSNLASSGAGNAVIANGNLATTSPFPLPATTLTVTQNSAGTFGGLIANTFFEITAPPNTFSVGAVSIVKQGSDSLTLSGSNTYTGNTTVSAGTLVAGVNAPSGGAGAFGSSTAAVTITGGSLLAANGVTVGRSMAVGSGASATLGATTGSSATFTGAIVLDPDTLTLTAPAGQSVTYSGGISSLGSGNSVIAAGPGTVVLSGTPSTYSGSTSVTGGTLRLDTTNVLPATTDVTIGNNATLTLNNVSVSIGSVGDGGTFLNTESVVISGASAALTVGASNHSATFSGIISGTGSLTQNGSDTFTLAGINTYSGTTTISNGTLALRDQGSIATSASVTLANATATVLDISGVGTGAAINQLSGGGATGGNINLGSKTLTVNTNASTTYAGNLGGISGGLTLAGNSATSSLTLTGNNTYSGFTTLNNGKLVVGSATGLSSTSTIKFLHSTSATNFPALDVTGFSINAAALLSVNGSGTLQLGAGTEALLLGDQTLTVGSNNGSSLFSGTVNGSSNSSLVKQGTGTFYLFNGTNSTTFLGNITIAAGYVIAGVDGSLGSANALITVQAGGSLTFAKNLVYNTAESVNLQGNGVMVGGASGYASGALQGNNATFAGSVHVQSSSLMQASGNLPTPTPFLKLTGAVAINGPATLTVGGHYNDVVIFAGPLTGTAIVTLGATGFTPHTVIAGSCSVPITVAAGTTLTVDGTDTGTVGVASGGTLYGIGSVGALTVSGTVQPGDPNNSFTSVGIGTLTAASADFSAGGTLKVLIKGTSVAQQFDVLNLGTGTLTLGGTSTLLADLNGLSSSGNLSTVQYPIATSSGVTGNFTTFTPLNAGSHSTSESISGNNVIVTVGGVGDAWAPGSSTTATAPSAPATATDAGQPVTVAVLDTGLDFSNPAAVPNIWINQAEIPAAVLSNLVDVYHDSFISFRDLQDPINQGPGKIEDVYHDGYISVRDLLAPLAEGGWATGRVDPADGLVDDIVGWNFVDNNNNPYDYSGHGTYSANQVTQIDPSAVIMPLQMLDRTGIGSITAATAALNYAVSHGARIALDAWVPYVLTPDWINAVAAAQAQGTLIITAAGNGSALALDNVAQAHLSNVVIVGAVDQSNRWAPFSNSGAGVVDLAAPGVDVVGLVAGGQYQAHSGTSVSAAQVAGSAALAWGLYPVLGTGDIVNALYGGADQIVGLAGDVSDGRVLNVAATLAAAAQLDQTGVSAAGAAVPAAGPAVVTAEALSGPSAAPVVFDNALTSEAVFATPQFLWAVNAPPSLPQTPSSLMTPMQPGSAAAQTVNSNATWSPAVDQGSTWLAFFVMSDPASGSGTWDTLASLMASIAPENE